MLREINIKGMSLQPSDKLVEDGFSEVCHNLMPQNNSLQPVLLPKEILSLQPNEKVICIHKVAGKSNYIFSRQLPDGVIGLYWLEDSINTIDTTDAIQFMGLEAECDIAIMGNTLCIATNKGIIYSLWRDGEYCCLGSRPPEIAIDFCPVERRTSIASDYSSLLPFDFTKATSSQTQPDIGFRVGDDFVDSLSDAVHALINRQISKHCHQKGYFWQPFFVRYAYRLYDGTNAWASPPILMLPTTLLPIVRCYGSRLNYGLGGDSLTTPCGLAFRIADFDDNALHDWKDIIVGIDIFVSAPIYTYNTNSKVKTFLTFRKAQEKSPALTEAEGNIFFPGTYGRPNNYSDPRDLPGVDFIPDVTPDPFPTDVDFSYRDISIPIDASTIYGDDYRAACYAQMLPNYNFHKDILGVSTFYHIHTYKLSEIRSMDVFDWIKVDCQTDSNTLMSRSTLDDNSMSLYSYIPQTLFSYNARLHIANLKLTPPKPFPYRGSISYQSHPIASTRPLLVFTSILTSYNGIPLSYHESQPDASGDLCECIGYAPRYYFYPDLKARLAIMHHSSSRKFYLTLKPSDFINGSHCFAGCAPNSTLLSNLTKSPTGTTDPLAGTEQIVTVPNALYVSQVNNPFSFPLSSVTTVGQGTILSLSAAVKALSQGQFGQFPLYAFCSDGVWALEPSATGAYVSRHPVTRDICINKKSVTQIDSGVIFVADRGIMLLIGADSTCISDSIDTQDVLREINTLPELMNVLHTYPTISPEAICQPPLSTYLTDLKFIYDYTGQRIIAYAPRHTFALIYSFKSRQWSTIDSLIADSINSYPEAYACTSDGKLVDYSKHADNTQCLPLGIVITRPFALEMPDVLKTIDTIIQRGVFHKGSVKTILYGSRDLFNWHLVWSSRDHFLRGFSGTPYKYFRMVSLSTLAKGETISGFTVQYKLRMTNRPR